MIDRKTFETLRARFAILGHTLQRVYRADDGRITYHVARNAQTRIFSHPQDLTGHLATLESVQIARRYQSAPRSE